MIIYNWCEEIEINLCTIEAIDFSELIDNNIEAMFSFIFQCQMTTNQSPIKWNSNWMNKNFQNWPEWSRTKKKQF